MNEHWTRCKYCLGWIDSPTSYCPYCKKDIDRQLASMIDEEVDILFERKGTFRPSAQHFNPDYLDYLEQCRAICNRIYIARNISLNEKAILEELKKIDKLNNHKCFEKEEGN